MGKHHVCFPGCESNLLQCDLNFFLTNDVGPVSLVMDLRIVHERWGSSSNPSLNGQLHYPAEPEWAHPG